MGSTKGSQQKYLRGASEGEKIGKGHHKGVVPGTADPSPMPGLKKATHRDSATVHGKPTHGG